MAEAAECARFLDHPRKGVDGPYRTIAGKYQGQSMTLYVVEQGSDSAYVAGRLAIRRGADFLMPFSNGTSERSLVEKWDWDFGEVMPVGKVFDFTHTAEFFSCRPDFHEPLSEDDKAVLTPRMTWESAHEGVSVGTFSGPMKSDMVARHLHRVYGITLFDTRLAGFMEAAREQNVSIQPFGMTEALISGNEVAALPAMEILSNLEQGLSILLTDEG